MHQQEVAGIVLLAHHLRHSGRHGNGGHTGGADERIDLLLEEQVHELGKQHAAGGAEAERHHAHNHDLDGLEGQERGAGSGAAHADAKENGNDVDKLILHRFAQPLRHAALLKEITQHQAGDEGRGRGHQQRHENSHNNGENNLFPLADLPQRLHDDLALLFRGQQLHDGRLNHR